MKITTDWLKSVLTATGHHPMGPSGAVRWMGCPGSVAATADIPDQPNAYALEGTKAHALAEGRLKGKIKVADKAEHDADMWDHVQDYLDYVHDHTPETARLYVEQDIDLTHLIPECRGTADLVYFTEEVLGIIDFKYGMGKVHATTPQLKIYLSGARKALADKSIEPTLFRVHIFQPRNGGGSFVDVTQQELDAFEEEVAVAAKRCMTDDAPLIPSEKACEWCRAKGTCPELYDHSLSVVGGDFDLLPATDTMTDDQLRLVLTNKTLIEKWLKSVESEISDRLNRGEAFDGFKLVAGRSIRQWGDNAEAVLTELLPDDAFEKKLIGITKAEKILGKKHLTELGITVKPEGKPTLVPDSDKRPAIALTADDFSEL